MFHHNSTRRLDHQQSSYSMETRSGITRQDSTLVDAQTAATIAFGRAQKRTSIYGNDVVSCFTHSHYSDDPAHRRTKNEHERIRRQHSVRFVGPNSTQKQMVPRKNVNKITTSKYKPSDSYDKISIPAISSPDFSPLIQRKIDCLVDPQSFINTFTDEESTSQKYNSEENSNTLLYPLDASNLYNPENFEEKCSVKSHHQFPHENLVANNLLSFLREKREQNEENDSAVNFARDRFLHEAVQQSLREKPSFFHRSRTPWQEQNSQTLAHKTAGRSGQPSPSLPDQFQVSRNPSFVGAARKATKSVTSTIQKALGLNKGDTILVPNQQVEARNIYACQYDSKTYTEKNSSTETYDSDRASIANVATHMPSTHDLASQNQTRSHAGSIKSSKTDNSIDKSRVTSWNSTAVDSVVSQTKSPSPQKIETCLSTIGGKGGRFPLHSGQVDDSNRSFQDKTCFTTSATISSARIYSALMKRIKPNYPRAETDKRRGAYLKQSSCQKYDGKMGEPNDYAGKRVFMPTIKRVFSGKSVDTSSRINIHKKSHNQWEDEKQMASVDEDDCSHKINNPCRSFQESKMPQTNMQATHELPHPKKRINDETRSLEMTPIFSTASYTRSCGEGTDGNAYRLRVKKVTQKPTLNEVRLISEESYRQECESTHSDKVTSQASDLASRSLIDKDSSRKLSALQLPNYYPPQSPQLPQLCISQYEGSINSENVRIPENTYTESIYSSSLSMRSKSSEKLEDWKLHRSHTPSYGFLTTSQSDNYTRDFESCLYENSSSDNINNSMIEMPTSISRIQSRNEAVKCSLDNDTAMPVTPNSFHIGHFREHTQVFDAKDEEDFQYVSKVVMEPTSLNQQNSDNVANKDSGKEKTISRDVNQLVNPANFSHENSGGFSTNLTLNTPPVPFRSLLRTVQFQDSAKINLSENASQVQPTTSTLRSQEPLCSLGSRFGKLCPGKYKNSIESDHNQARSQSIYKSDGLVSTPSLTLEERLTHFGNGSLNSTHFVSEQSNDCGPKQLKLLNEAVKEVNNVNIKIDENTKITENLEDHWEKEYTSETEELSDCFL